MLRLDLIIGSGGVLSHAPDRKSSALMMIDAYEPVGVTKLAVDSIFMMPHLGVFSTVHPQAASEIFLRDCLVDLGTVIAPIGRYKKGEACLTIEFSGEKELTLHWGDLIHRELGGGETREIKLKPLHRSINVGNGPGNSHIVNVSGGHAGIIFDGRGRPIRMPSDPVDRRSTLANWFSNIGIQNAGGI
jgi:hypothetical protein